VPDGGRRDNVKDKNTVRREMKQKKSTKKKAREK
jgi:hypothetical protein